MRLESIHAINTNEKNNNQSNQNAGAHAGKRTPGVLFEDYLKAQIQQISAPAITRQTENQVAGLLLGYISPLRVSLKSQPAQAELEISAS